MKKEIVFLTSALAFSSTTYALTIDGEQVTMTREELSRLLEETKTNSSLDENLSLVEELESRGVLKRD